MFDLVIKGAIVVLPGGSRQVDIAIKDGLITKISDSILEDSKKTILAEGKHLLPGIIDCHVHFRDPGDEEKEDMLTGTKAALAGGVTTVLDMPNTNPPTIDQKSLDIKKAKARSGAFSNIGFFLGVSEENINIIEKIKGYVAIKMYIGSSTGGLLVKEKLLQEEVFKKKLGKLICVHAEDETMILEAMRLYENENDPEIHSCIRHAGVAEKAVLDVIEMARKYDQRVHICHVSSELELTAIREAKKEGLKITCEVAPHHLFLTYDVYEKMGNFVKMNPPLRSEMDTKEMFLGLLDGTVDIVATDHAPHTQAEKEKNYWEAPAGVPGVETSLPLMLHEVNTGRISLETLVDRMCTKPAEIFGIKNKGVIKEGYDADLVLVNLNLEKKVDWAKLYTKCKWSPYKNWDVKGWPIKTFIKGEEVFSDGNFKRSGRIDILG